MSIPDIKSLYNLFNKTSVNNEFEIIFFSKSNYITLEKYIHLLKYLKAISKDKLNDEITLDIDVTINNITYRITIVTIETINELMSNQNNTNVLFKILLNKYENNIKNINLMKKIKHKENLIEIPEFNLRARLSEENIVSKDEITMLYGLENINSFRLKQRITCYVQGDKDSKNLVKIDLTHIKSGISYTELTNEKYELEVECQTNSPTKETFDLILKSVYNLLKVIQNSNFLITTNTQQDVLNYYRKILQTKKEHTLDGRQPRPLEIQFVTETIINKYAVTDKADGDRYFLIIYNKNVYLISSLLEVKYTGIELKNNTYDGTILDGEYIFLTKYGRHLFLAFDCLTYKTIDIRTESIFMNRIEYIDEVIDKCFILDKQKNYKYKKNESKEFTLENQLLFHEKEIINMFNILNHDIEQDKKYILVRRKYFIPCKGVFDWEIFAYANLIWTLYTNYTKTKCPYILDGLIFSPLDQKYITNIKDKNYLYSDYKWKPEHSNSIDFYVEYMRDSNGNILTVYDNSYSNKLSDEDYLKNKPYRILKLFVGQQENNIEVPILFNENENLHLAYIYLNNDEARDINNNIIIDKTVIECYYNTHPDIISDYFRWVVIRTRHDKTESVQKYKTKYGNFITTAQSVWDSIQNPVKMEDFQELAIGNNYQKNIHSYDNKLIELKNRISHEIVVKTAKENAYYNERNNKYSEPMRKFHNGIKSELITLYLHPRYKNILPSDNVTLFNNKTKISVLDIGCGKGGDNNKFFEANISNYVGIDIDYQGLISKGDGAIDRYMKLKEGRARYVEMMFIQADATLPLDLESQLIGLNGMTQQNISNIKKVFSKNNEKKIYYDAINCQFAIHYMFKNETTWTNFKTNINNYLKNGGYIIITTFDAQKIINLLDGKENFKFEITNETGEKIVLYDIIKKYTLTKNEQIKTGHKIDVLMDWINKKYLTEYLVDKDFLISEFEKDCDLHLVDTDDFENQYNIHKQYFTKYVQYQHESRTKKSQSDIKSFYDDTDLNKGLRKFSDLSRYYVFRKSIKTKGGDITENIFDFDNELKYWIPNMLNINYDNNMSIINAIHNIMRTHTIIPKYLNVNSFMQNLKIEQDELTDINKIAQKIIIYNTIKNITKLIIDQITIFIIENNCNNEYDIEVYNKNCSNIILLLKKNNIYYPIYVIKNNNTIGLFNNSDDIIQKLLIYTRTI